MQDRKKETKKKKNANEWEDNLTCIEGNNMKKKAEWDSSLVRAAKGKEILRGHRIRDDGKRGTEKLCRALLFSRQILVQ